MAAPFVSILMGSDSDLPVMEKTCQILKKFDIPYEVRIYSAHRTPEDTKQFVVDAEDRGCAVFIAGAGLSAALPGVVAAYTTRPVIGVPIDTGPLQGVDALLSMVQMPPGIPVATVAIGSVGARNAGYLAAQMLGMIDQSLAAKIKQERLDNAQVIRDKNEGLSI